MENRQRIDGAVRLLPPKLRAAVTELPDKTLSGAEEIRLRTGFRPTLLTRCGESEFGADDVTARDLDAVLETATGASVHTARDSLRAGFVTVRGGYRIGVCGSAVTKNGEVAGFRAVSSLCVRIPAEIRGVSGAVLDVFMVNGVRSTLILSPPGAGKTTLLRDLVRALSDGDAFRSIPPHRVGLADERGEIAAVCDGAPQLYVGRRTDILDSCPKAEAVLMLTRVMNPEIVALDEITSPEDVRAVERACLCGAKLVATAHAGSPEELGRKPVFRQLLDSGVFELAVTISVKSGERVYNVQPL